MKPVRLVTLTAPISMIADQLSFLSDALSYFDVPSTTGTSLDENSLNVVIEGFTPFGARYVRDFCEATGKKISVVMTEHIALDKEILFNDVPLSKANEYMPNAPGRLRNLCQILPYVRSFWIAGHLPDGQRLTEVFRQMPLVHVPYIPIVLPDETASSNRRFELSFTGTTTQYRSTILDEINKYYNCCHAFSDQMELRRGIIMESTYTLQVPQHARWRYLSPMRALFALRWGTPMLNISEFEDELFDVVVPRILPRDLIASLSHYLSLDSREVYRKSVATYNEMAQLSVAASKLATIVGLWNDLE